MNAPQKIATIADPLDGTVGWELRRASVAVANALSAQIEPLGLRTSDATMLLLIGTNPGSTQTDVGRAMRVQPANMVPLINKLVSAGLVERIPGTGRALALHLTAEGTRLFGEVKAAFARHEARITRLIPKDRREEMVETLRGLIKAACCDDL